MSKMVHAAFVAVALGAFPSAAQAQGDMGGDRSRFGVQVTYGNDSEFGVGGRLRYSLRGLFPTVPLSGIAQVEVFFPGNSVTWIEANYSAVYNFNMTTAPKVAPYAGAGLNFVHADFNGATRDRLGLNLVAGMGFRSAGRVMPFVELRGTISGSEQLLLTGGILF